MEELLVELNDMKDYLGESGTYNDILIRDMILSAQEQLQRSTGVDFRRVRNKETARRVVKMTVWLEFYADRDEAKNADYIVRSRDRLVTMLQYGGDIENATP